TREVIELGQLPGVDYLGFVEDVRPHLWQSAVCVVPLKSGGGTRLKILEAAAAGCPVVSTAIGAEGLGMRNMKELLVANSDGAFATAVVELLRNRSLVSELIENGRTMISQKFDWSVVGPKLEQAYYRVIERHKTR
ncbi:MAG: glycosyltransferase family 4 protein, partial [Oceanospirillum sp.]|nr:glycosyltransferase family 4 protein [Oceanospirillum sp.]